MLFRSHDDIEDLPDSKELKASERELKMAQQLIESLSSDFEPERYHDEYREKVLELIEMKASGQEIAVQPEAPAPPWLDFWLAAGQISRRRQVCQRSDVKRLPIQGVSATCRARRPSRGRRS